MDRVLDSILAIGLCSLNFSDKTRELETTTMSTKLLKLDPDQTIEGSPYCNSYKMFWSIRLVFLSY